MLMRLIRTFEKYLISLRTLIGSRCGGVASEFKGAGFESSRHLPPADIKTPRRSRRKNEDDRRP